MKIYHVIMCAYCGASHDMHQVVDGKEIFDPVPGDFTLCFACGQWLVFTKDQDRLLVRKTTEFEADVIARDERCQRLKAAWVLAKITAKE